MKELILIGSSDVDYFLLLSHIFEADGYNTVLAKGIEEIFHLAGDKNTAAVLLDCRPGPFDALEACLRIRNANHPIRLPVIALIGAGTESQYVDLQKAGADECFMRPFAPLKLLQHLRNRLFPRARSLAGSQKLSHAGIEIDFDHHRVTRNGREIHLGPIEFNLLRCLLEKATQICGRADLLERTWPGYHHVEERTLNVHIGRLRKALSQPGEPDFIKTIRGVGYILGTADDSASELNGNDRHDEQ